MQRWEYRVETSDTGLTVGQLDAFGRDGWELVSETVVTDDRRRTLVRAVLKKPRD